MKKTTSLRDLNGSSEETVGLKMCIRDRSRKASRGDQILNANSFKKEGYSLVLEEEEITKESFLSHLEELRTRKKELISKMNAKQGEVGTSAVIKTIMDVMRK